MGYMTNGLSFNTLREANQERLPHFKNSKGEPAHCDKWTIADWLQALVGEVGEYANFAKKYKRGDIDHQTFLNSARKELADIQIYLDILAGELGLDLGQITKEKFNEVSERIGVDVFITIDDWSRVPEDYTPREWQEIKRSKEKKTND